jgi:spermidine synthase
MSVTAHSASPSPRPGTPVSPALAGALTFVAAGAVLVLEIAATRLLAPFVGTSLTTYTAIIGVILGGIALGAWAGGRAADTYGPTRLLGPAFVAGGLAAIASIPLVAALGSARLGSNVEAVVLYALIGFAAPATLLSAVGPMIVRASIVDVGTSGSLVGRLSAIGTAGAISGTFLTGFVLLGLVPTRVLVVGAGALLVLVGILVGWRLRRSRSVVVGGIAGVLLLGGVALAIPSPCERESAYYCIAVLEEADPDGRTLVLDALHHAYVDLADPTVLRFAYVRWFAALSADRFDGRAVNALHIGGGGFSFPRYLLGTYPDSRHTVLELDPEVLVVAREELGFTPSEQIRVEVADARLSIADLPAGSFDLAVGDAFGGRSVPWQLTTREFLSQVDRVLRPDGRYVMNVIDGEELRFARAEAATMRSVFRYVALVATPATLDVGVSAANLVLVASNAPLDGDRMADELDALQPERSVRLLATDEEIAEFIAGATALTDDFAPVDLLIAR